MISDNDLKIAAEKASTAILAALPEAEHEFSPEHERKIAAIGRKARLKKVLSAVECTSHEVTVGGTTATVYVPVENEFNYTRKTLAFIKGGCLITIAADLDEPELIKIAESVKLSGK